MVNDYVGEDDLSQLERIRACAHRDVDHICAVWPAARLDAQARGYGTGRSFDGTSRGGGELTSVEAAADRPDFATWWVSKLGDVILAFGLPATLTEAGRGRFHAAADTICDTWPKGANRVLLDLHHLAEDARNWWPDRPTRGTVIAGVTIGQRGNQSETCGLCGYPVVSGRDEAGNALLRRDKDGTPFHGTAIDDRPACYWVVWRQRRRGVA